MLDWNKNKLQNIDRKVRKVTTMMEHYSCGVKVKSKVPRLYFAGCIGET